MKIKKFKAKTFSEALALVKREMGVDAVILSSEEQKGLIPGVEVTAGADYELEELKAGGAAYAQYARASLSPAPEKRRGAAIEPASGRDVSSRHLLPDTDGITDIRKELGSLKNLLQDMKKSGFEVELPEPKKKIFRYLRKRAIREELALRLTSQSPAAMSDLVNAIAKEIRTYQDVQSRKVVMLIGPTGVGKTTTLAKLAARAIKNNRKVAMINLDTYRIGAIEQIRIYSKIMGIPLEVASNAGELKKGLEKFAEKDMIFIDTTGRNPRDRKHIEELRLIYSLGIPIETHLLMSASSDDDFLVQAYRQYKKLPIDCIAFTKTDEAVKYGSMYNLASLYQKPVAYITTGQSVPADIEFPNSERLATMILQSEVASDG
ncbi:MAG: flagellar biosynthesis protein FlhF [Nitrospirae bacterium]|nr:flagellar biosynthesis protein FlhF [Nitrospirota bacterium]